MVFSIHFCSYVIPGLTLDSDSLMYWIPAVAGMTFMADCVYRVDRLPPVGSGKNIQLTHADLNKMGDIPSPCHFRQ